MSAETTFHLWGMLPSHLVPPAKQVLAFTCSFLDRETKRFDWDTYISRIQHYPTPDLVLEKHASDNIASQSTTIKALADDASKIIKQFAPVSLSIDETARRIVEVFTSLKDAEEAGVSHYEPDGSGSAVSYRIFLAIPDHLVENQIRLVVITIKTQADFADKSTWSNLQATSDHRFSAILEMAMLIATPEFVAPN
ncbi:unnamed protein product [Rhizoctonia solani]|uniref:Delta-endotoxin CytB n=1 Tax=Rhizoctonia solani TaxID=456999 RepID=A0A8H3DXL9_9AGAM|nr:unnamed protein product [Rhizoctonia solani]